MTLTRSFKETVTARIEHDEEFRDALFRKGIDCLLSGDVDTGKAVLRYYINATIGFENLGEAINTPPKSLMRMFSQKDNPQAKNLFAVILYLQTQRGIHLKVRTVN
jgi:hypothetical protein